PKSAWESESVQATLMSHQYAPTATTDITLTLARPTATTDLTGLQVECLSAPAHGMAGAVMVGVVGAVATMVAAAGVDTVVAAGATDMAIMGAAALPEIAALRADAGMGVVLRASVAALAVDFVVARPAEGFTAAADSTVEVVGSTAAVVDTAVAADTDNLDGSAS
ncbi:MAG: hypothetical protein WBW46_16320, partial [Candidatus Sulfotelmatobacter sp.]